MTTPRGCSHPVYRALGRWIIARRGEMGLTQIDLACRLGWSPQKLSWIERGRQKVSLDQFLAIMAALERDVSI